MFFFGVATGEADNDHEGDKKNENTGNDFENEGDREIIDKRRFGGRSWVFGSDLLKIGHIIHVGIIT